MINRKLFAPFLALICAGFANAQTGLIQTYAGNGTSGFSGDGGPAVSASIATPFGLALDANGNLYIAVAENQRVRVVNSTSGIITTVAGGGTGGNGGLATSAELSAPCDVKLDSSGNIYLSDSCLTASSGGGGGGRQVFGPARVWRVDAITGIITTVAGGGTSGFGGDGGPATSALLSVPAALAIDASGNIYIADSGNNRIRRIDGVTGIITTVAGNGTAAFAGDGGPATAASLNDPAGIAIDGAGNLYVADTLNNRIRLINAASGIISTLAGTGNPAFNGDGIPATAANINTPFGLLLNSSGNLLIADTSNYRVRLVDMSSGLIWTLAGEGSAPSGCCGIGDGSPATKAALNFPAGLALSPAGSLFVSELEGNRVREISLPSPFASSAVTLSANASSVPADNPLTLTATLSAINGLASNATGGVSFLDGTSTLIGSAPLANGSATLTTSTLSQGVHTINAFYSGDPAFAYAVAPPFSISITAPQATVVLAASPNPAAANQTITLTATLTPSTALGTITFLNGATTLGTASVISGSATLSGVTLASGSYSLSAQYGGGNPFPPATSPAISLTVKAVASVVVTSSANPSNTKQSVVFTAAVTPASATGTVQFLDGTALLGSATLTNGSASFSPASLSSGTHSISANYSGDANDLASTSAIFTQTVQASSSVTLSSTPNPAAAGVAVSLAAAVTPSTATGNVQFLDGTTVLGTVALANGSASFTTASLAQGTHSITAAYGGDANDTSATSTAVTQTVQALSSIALTSTPNPATSGAAVTFAVTVTPSLATGTVQFLDGSTVLGASTLTNASAAFTTSSLGTGPHSITAKYSGDANDTAATSSVLTQTIQVSSSIVLSASPNPATVGAGVTLTAAVTPSAATGNVKFLDGTTVLGAVALTNGVATFTTSSLTQGSHSITAAYSGDSNDTSATSAVLTQTVQASSSVALTSSQNPGILGTPITFTAAVTPSAATGTVQFLDGTTVLGTVTLAGGTALFTTSSLSQGTHSITAAYSGDANDAASSSAPLSESVKIAPGFTTGLSPSPAVAGQTVTLTANVNASATGTVTFTDGATVLATVAVASGTAAFSTSSLAQGSHTLGISYSGDTIYLAASTTVPETVLGATSIALGSSLNPASSSQVVTFSATVTPAAATGTVQFYDGAALLATSALTSGVATYSTSSLSAGTHSITADYGGSSAYGPSYSGALPEVVKGTTSTSLASSLNPSTAGSAIVFTAAVSPSPATGAVQFLDGATVLGSATLANGSASFTTSALSPGTHSITASYGGSATYNASNSSALSETVKANTSVALSSSLNPAPVGSATTFTATVTPASATGTVQFLDGTTLLGSAALASGRASFTTSSLSQGANSITASYGGDAADASSNSAPLVETVNPAPPAAPSNLTATAAGSSQINLAWTPSVTSGVSYDIYQSTTSGFSPSGSNLIASGITAPAYAASNLNSSTTYYYRVTSVNAGGSSAATNQASATTTGAFACHVSYSVTGQWNNGFTSAVSIQNTGAIKITSWTLTWTWPGNQAITESWNANYTQKSAGVTLTNESYNNQIAAGATLSGIGFNASYSGTNVAPSAFYVNSTLCR